MLYWRREGGELYGKIWECISYENFKLSRRARAVDAFSIEIKFSSIVEWWLIHNFGLPLSLSLSALYLWVRGEQKRYIFPPTKPNNSGNLKCCVMCSCSSDSSLSRPTHKFTIPPSIHPSFYFISSSSPLSYISLLHSSLSLCYPATNSFPNSVLPLTLPRQQLMLCLPLTCVCLKYIWIDFQ